MFDKDLTAVCGGEGPAAHQLASRRVEREIEYHKNGGSVCPDCREQCFKPWWQITWLISGLCLLLFLFWLFHFLRFILQLFLNPNGENFDL
jgi:hypothetical protein